MILGLRLEAGVETELVAVVVVEVAALWCWLLGVEV